MVMSLLAATFGSVGIVFVAEPVAAAPQDARISEARPMRRADGHVDSLATISRLKQLHVDSQMFLIWRPTDWDDLRLDFAPAAQRHGIKVWVYLRSPSRCETPDCTDYPPYGKDYVRWAEAIARLSVSYPVVTAWAIDDFANANNLDYLTAAYMSRARQASRAIQPTLEFYPLVYHDLLTASFVNGYAPVFDALIMPYRDGAHRNTAWTGTLRNHIDTAAALLAERNRKLILMVYARSLSSTEIAPDVGYVQRITAAGMDYLRRGTIAGIVHFGLNLNPGEPSRNDWNYAHGSGRGALAFVLHPEEATTTGDFVAASNTVRLNSGSTSCQVRIRHTDNRGTTAPRGYHFMQLLVAGSLRWEQDVAADDGGELGYHVSPWLDVSHLMGSGLSTITLRLYERRGVPNYQVRLRLDDLEFSGCTVSNPSFESTTDWVLHRSDGPLHGALHLYDPVYSTTVYDLIAEFFAA